VTARLDSAGNKRTEKIQKADIKSFYHACGRAKSSEKSLGGRTIPIGSIMAQDYLRPAAVNVGILAKGDRRRCGFHALRHSLGPFLVTQTKTDVATVQAMMRHADVDSTLNLYTHVINRDKLVAQNEVIGSNA
jgi:integrase